ncbi:RING-box protein 2 [Schistocerca americana]|uniref:RING-box protein 2 n=1 Tax=Schistocerca americana TaxID=7009 RepID=UPI001F5039C2|nr:RING-box protein 2 [Schistocerca americana]
MEPTKSLEPGCLLVQSTSHTSTYWLRCFAHPPDACLRCQAESKQDSRQGRAGQQDCVVVWGECNHSFHYCCMSLWVKQNNRCPLCQQEWSIQRMGK